MRRTGRNLRPLGRGGDVNSINYSTMNLLLSITNYDPDILPEKRTIEDLNIVSNNYFDIIKLKSMHNETNHTNTIN